MGFIELSDNEKAILVVVIIVLILPALLARGITYFV